ncbi:MAG: bifunctional oligoribonuclease/PAP phosphatase NrnA [Candidatus Thorarchaeota archaeon]
MLDSKYEEFLTFLKGKKILITTHDLVDIDGFVSCYALKFFLIQHCTKTISIFFSELSKYTKDFILSFSENFPEFVFTHTNEENFSEFDVCIIIDTNDLSQIQFNRSKTIKLEIPYIFIDHHYFDKSILKNGNIASLNLINDDVSSTSEIILELLEYFNQNLTVPYKNLIIAAILTDSGFFKYGNNQTIKNVSKLLGEEVNFQQLKVMLKNEDDISERIAKIKGLQRVELIREGDYLIGISHVSSFGARVASLLIKMGFDISIVYSKEKNKNLINCRAKQSICMETGLHLGKILEEISEYSEGSGGGHDGAASLSFNSDLDTVLLKLVERIKQFL